jgi:hypothetical protein
VWWLDIAVEGGDVVFYQGGTQLRISDTPPPSVPLSADTSIASSGAVVADAVLAGDLVVVALEPPVLSVPSGCYDTSLSVKMISPDGAELRYTEDGSGPTEMNGTTAASGWELTVSGNTTLKVRAFATGYVTSGVTVGTYTFDVPDPRPVEWINDLGVAIDCNSLTKTEVNGWNAGAVSRQMFSGEGFIEFTAEETGMLRSAGLSHVDEDWHYTTIDYAFYLSPRAITRSCGLSLE